VKPHNIGNVAVFRGAPPHDNPHRGGGLAGAERATTLHQLSPYCWQQTKKSFALATADVQLWLVPAEGGARRIAVNEINWFMYNPENTDCKQCFGNPCSIAGKGV
jgi:hypothetical protein